MSDLAEDPEDGPDSEQERPSEADDFDDTEWPEESSHALEEAEAYITQAKKQRPR